MSGPPELPGDLGEVIAHLESEYPNEGCGVILRDGRGRFRIRPMKNVQDRYHAKDPVSFPRTARTAYLFDPREQYTVWEEEAPSRGEQVVCIFHSHADAGAYFSAEDREMAAPDGRPLLPDVSYLVVAVDGGRASGAKVFWWDQGGYQEAPVRLVEAKAQR